MLKAGAQFFCANGHVWANVTKDMRVGTPMMESMQIVQGPAVVWGAEGAPPCVVCGASLVNARGQYYTSEGQLP